MKTHIRMRLFDSITACGRPVADLRMVLDVKEVTCNVCQKRYAVAKL